MKKLFIILGILIVLIIAAWGLVQYTGPTSAPLVVPAAQEPIPSQPELLSLIHNTMVLFSQNVQKAQQSYTTNQWLENESTDFAQFYDALAQVWQAQTDPAALRALFSDFIIKNIPVDWIQDTQPILTGAPKFDEHQVLLVPGQYNQGAMTLVFTLGYYYEAPSWKLAQIEVKTQ